MIGRVARYLGPLLNEVVFVGGATVELLLSRPLVYDLRVTRDVDFIMEVMNLPDYYRFSDRLRNLGFREKVGGDHPICSWTIDNLLVDAMPTNENILGFTNRWYEDAVLNSLDVQLEKDLSIRLVSPQIFLATKFEAFRERGDNDLFMSHDFEDILTLLDGRPEIVDEIQKSKQELQAYLRSAFIEVRKHPDFPDAVTGHFPGNPVSNARIVELMESINTIVGEEE